MFISCIQLKSKQQGKHQTKVPFLIHFSNRCFKKCFLIQVSGSQVGQCKDHYFKASGKNMKNTKLFFKSLPFSCHVNSLAVCPTPPFEWNIGMWRTGYMKEPLSGLLLIRFQK